MIVIERGEVSGRVMVPTRFIHAKKHSFYLTYQGEGWGSPRASQWVWGQEEGEAGSGSQSRTELTSNKIAATIARPVEHTTEGSKPHTCASEYGLHPSDTYHPPRPHTSSPSQPLQPFTFLGGAATCFTTGALAPLPGMAITAPKPRAPVTIPHITALPSSIMTAFAMHEPQGYLPKFMSACPL